MRFALTAIALFLVSSDRLQAGASNWTSTSSTAWGTSGNWSSGVPTSTTTVGFTDNTTIQHSVSLGANRSAASLTFNNGTGSAGFTLSGAFNLTLSSGITNNDAATQVFSYTNTILSANQTFNAASGGLTFDSNIHLGNTGTSRTLTISGGNFTTTVNGVVSNGAGGATAGILNYSGSGTLVLAGANTYGGSTTITNGTVNLRNDTALGTTAGATTVTSGAISLQNNITVAEALTINGTGVGSNGALRNISGNNALTGTIALASNAEIQSDAGLLTLGAGGISGSGGSRTLTFDGAGNITVDGAIASSIGALNKNGTGTLLLTNNSNAFTGLTTVNGGTLAVSAANALGVGSAAAGVYAATGATFAVQGGITLNPLESIYLSGTGYTGRNGALDNISGDNTVGAIAIITSARVGAAGGTTLTASGLVTSYSGTTPLSIGGTGTVFLSNAGNTYTGATTVESGATLRIESSGALGNAANTVALSGGTLLGSTTFALDAARGISLVNGTNNTISAAGGTFTVNGVVSSASGTTPLSVGGTGIVELANAGNTYLGKTTIGSGATLQIATTGALGNSGNDIALNGGTLLATTSIALGSGRNVDLGTAGGGTFNVQSGALLVDGIVSSASGSTPLTISGPGTVFLSNAANTFTGTTTISSGSTLQIDSGGALGNAGNSLAINGGTLSGLGTLGLASTRSVTFGGAGNTISAAGGTTLTIDGLVSSSGTTPLAIAGTGGTVVLGNAGNTFTGDTSLASGTTLEIAADGALGNAANGVSIDGATLRASATTTLGASRNVSLVNAAGNTLSSSGGTFTVDGVVSSAAGTTPLTIAGAGIVHLSNGGNTYTGATTIASGATLQIGANGALGTAGNDIVISDGTLLGSGTFSLLGARDITLSGNTNNTISAATGTTLTIGGNILPGTGTTPLTIGGGGTVAFGAANSFTGNITIGSGSTLRTSTNGQLGVAANDLILENGTFQFGGSYTVAVGRTFTLTAGAGGGTIDFGGNATARVNGTTNLNDQDLSIIGTSGGQVRMAGAIAGSGGLEVDANGGTVLFTMGSNTFTGVTTVNQGTLIVDTTNNSTTGAPPTTGVGIRGDIVVGNNSGTGTAVLQTGQAGSNANNVISANSNVTVNETGSFNLLDQVQNIRSLTFVGGQVDIGSAGTLYLNGGGIGGTSTISTTGSSQTATISGYQMNTGPQNDNTGTSLLQFDVGLGAADDDLLVSAGIYGGSIEKLGGGNLVLSGTSGFTGTTTVSAGVLTLRSDGALGAHGGGSLGSGTSVVSGATLQLENTVNLSQEALRIAGTGSNSQGAINSQSGANVIGGPITLTSTATINSTSAAGGDGLSVTGSVSGANYALTVGGAGNTTFSDAVSLGTAGFVKSDTGTVTFAGSATNAINGLTVNTGTVILANTSASNSTINGDVTVGSGIGTALLQLGQNEQLTQSATVTVAAAGTFDLDGNTQTIAAVTGAGTLALGSGTLVVGDLIDPTPPDSAFSGLVTGSGTLIKQSSSTLTISGNINFGGSVTVNGGTLAFTGTSIDIAGTLTLGAGTTLRLNNPGTLTANIGAIHITGNTVIDFGGGSASILSTANLTIDPGVTLVSIINWNGEGEVPPVDRFYATNFVGSTLGTRGLGSELQITFSGYSNSATAWLTYDNQITPAPEPGTYGLILSGTATLLVALRRRMGKRSARSA